MKFRYLSLIFLLCVFLYTPLYSQGYLDRIENHLYKTSIGFPIDSVNKYRNEYYQIKFNFNEPLVVNSYDDCMKEIELTGYLDSLKITNNAGKVVGDFNIYVGEDVPFKVSQAVISFFLEQRVEGLNIILRKNDPFSSGFGIKE